MLSCARRRFAWLLLGASIPVWWAGLLHAHSFRELFVATDGWPMLQSFLWPDLVLAAVTGAAGVLRGRWSPVVAGVALGGWCYASVWTWRAFAVAHVGLMGAVLMTAATALVAMLTHATLSTSEASTP